MPRGLADRMSLGFQLLAGIAELLPVLREFLVADFGEPGFAIGDKPAANAPRHADPFVADRGDLTRDVVIAALFLADLFRDVAGIGKAVGVKLRPVADRHDNIGSGTGLDRRGDARLNVVGVDCFEVQLEAERLLAFLGDLALQQLIRGRHEI